MRKIIVLLVILPVLIYLILINYSTGQTKTSVPMNSMDKPLTQGIFSAIAQKVTPSVVNVFNMQERGVFATETKGGGGTGFIIDSRKGIILTNYHVIKGAKGLVIALSDKRTFNAKLIGGDPLYDVAVVQITNPPADLKQVAMGNSEKVIAGQWVVAIGQPLFMEYTLTTGVVCALGREIEIGGKKRQSIEYKESYIQIDVLINPGNSGGPLFNLNAEVIGINTATGKGYGYSIPINDALVIRDHVMKTGKVIRAYLGLIGSDFNDLLARRYNTTLDDLVKDLGLKAPKGIFIQGALEDSPASSVEFQEGDALIELDGKKVDNLKEFRAVISNLKPDNQVKIKYIRKGIEEITTVTLGKIE